MIVKRYEKDVKTINVKTGVKINNSMLIFGNYPFIFKRGYIVRKLKNAPFSVQKIPFLKFLKL